MRKPLALDLFCGAGGASMGLHRAGFEVVGIDIAPQPNYPFAFIQADALRPPVSLARFDFIWASPKCQRHTLLNNAGIVSADHVDQLDDTRSLLVASGRPYVIENVVGAPLRSPLLLCGAMFPGLRVYRHRLFESNVLLMGLPHPKHSIRCAPCGKIPSPGEWWSIAGKFGGVKDAAAAMGIDWMQYDHEVSQAIPPVFAEFVARQAMKAVLYQAA